MKAETSDLKELRWYLEKKFIYTSTQFQTFYRVLFSCMHKKYYARYFSSDEDFDDLFQLSMLKFCEPYQRGKYQIDTNGQAYAIIATIFHNNMVNMFRKRKVTTDLTESLEQSLVEEDVSHARSRVSLQEVFANIDNRISRKPNIFSDREAEFYKLYKYAVTEFDTEKDVQTYVIQQMKINESYYRSFKSIVSTKLAKLAGDSYHGLKLSSVFESHQ